MIYSILQQKQVPITVTKDVTDIPNYGRFIKYTVHDASETGIHVGYVDLRDTKNGVEVLFIKNQHPNLYKHFGKIADQIEIEHCIKRGINNPYIQSEAALGSHIQHFKRGKRFINEGVNVFLQDLVSNLQKGQREYTRFLGNQPMFMPQNLVNEIKEKIKATPLLKGIK